MNRRALIVAGIILISLLGIFFFKRQNHWMLSLYKGGGTLLRLGYPSKETCISEGRSWLADGRADRFDCGNRCSSFDRNSLMNSPICKTICNESGCIN